MAWHTSGCGRINLNLPRGLFRKVPLTGQADAAAAEIVAHPFIRPQLGKIDPGVLREELDGYGCWNFLELSDHEANLRRYVWLACCDLQEEEACKA